jgi:hypothetical protein
MVSETADRHTVTGLDPGQTPHGQGTAEAIGLLESFSRREAMRPFKRQLLGLLSESGWELVSRDDDTNWWVEEHWLVRSVRENWGQELVLSFLVEPRDLDRPRGHLYLAEEGERTSGARTPVQ